jgi:hypothetical protein
MSETDAPWRKRFQLFALVRLFGVACFLGGIAIAFSDWLRPGGWPLVGGIIMILGLVDSIYAPILLKKHWAAEDKER